MNDGAKRRPQTNPHLSASHRGLMEKQLRTAHSLAELKNVAEFHGKFLLGKDAEEMRVAYKRRVVDLQCSIG